MSPASAAIRRPVTTLMIFAGVIIVGLVMLPRLPVDFLPDVRVPKLTVRIPYPDTAPEEVEYVLTAPVESVLGTVPGVRRMRSVTREGLALIGLEFSWGADMDYALLEVREKLEQVRTAFPPGAGRPTILRVDPSAEPVMSIAVSSAEGHPGGGMHELEQLRETVRALLKRRFEQVDGVAQAAVLGGAEREIHVEVDPGALRAHGLSMKSIADALSAANVHLPGGSIVHGHFRYALRTMGEFVTLRDIQEAVVRSRRGAGPPLRLRECATVRETHRERQGFTRVGGEEVVVVQLRKEAGTNTVEICGNIRAVLAQLRQEYPSLSLTVVADQSEFIRHSVEDVRQAILTGALLVFLVLFFFLRHPRYPLIVGLTMPVSVTATLVAMSIAHVSVNIISLTGLALGVGMLGDNAIVVVEHVTRLREQRMPLVEATLLGAKEIGTAVTASTLTNVAVFLPVACVEGLAAELFVDMGVTMAIALLVSLVVSVTLVPMLVSREHLLPVRLVHEHLLPVRLVQRMRSWLPGWGREPLGVLALCPARIDRIAQDMAGRYLAWALEHRTPVCLCTVLLLALSVAVALRIPAESTPEVDQHCFAIHLRMPRGTSLAGTSAYSGILERLICTMPGIRSVYARVGVSDEQSLWNVDGGSADVSLIEVAVEPGEQTDVVVRSVRRLLKRFADATTGIEYAVRSRGTTFEQILRPEADDIRCRVVGNSDAAVRRIAGVYADRIRLLPGLVDLRTSLQRGTPEYHLTVDRGAVRRYGLNVEDVAAHITDALRGVEATGLQQFDRKIPVRVQQPAIVRSTLRDLLNTPVIADGRNLSARSLVTWEETDGYAEIWRENQQRAHVLVANVSGRSIQSMVRDLEEVAGQMALPRGCAILIGGENEETRASLGSLLVVILLSLLLVFMILAAEYESVLYPLVILLTSPLAFVGVIAAMAVTGQHHSVMSLVGLVIIIGAVDNDAVILVDRFMALRRQGVSLHGAVREGMRERLRPILMTTATTVFGVVPVLLDFGSGSELVRALTVPLVGGLLASTLFTILTIPVVFAVFDRRGAGKGYGGSDG